VLRLPGGGYTIADASSDDGFNHAAATGDLYGEGTFYQSRTVQKVPWSDRSSTVPLSQRPAQWFQWLIPATVSGQSVMTTDGASFGVSRPQ